MTESTGVPPKSRAKWPLILAAVVAVVIVAVASAVVLAPRPFCCGFAGLALTLPRCFISRDGIKYRLPPELRAERNPRCLPRRHA